MGASVGGRTAIKVEGIFSDAPDLGRINPMLSPAAHLIGQMTDKPGFAFVTVFHVLRDTLKP